MADRGLLLAPTDPDAPTRSAITVFLVDMHDLRVTVRPLRQMAGSSHISEVFLDELPIPDEMRIGDVDAGWGVTMAVLGHERSLPAFHDLTMGPVDRLRALAAHGAPGDPRVRQRLAEVYIEARLLQLSADRASNPATEPAPAASVGATLKLAMATNVGRVASLAGDCSGHRSPLSSRSPVNDQG